jgi:hypothetical protein
MLEYYTNINTNERKNILKDEFTLNKSDYEKLKQSQQYNELYSKQYQENEKQKEIKENKNIYNMSIYTLIKNSSKVSMDILEDLTIYISQKNKNLNNFFIIFTKDDRLIYVGILFIILSFSLWFIDISK